MVAKKDTFKQLYIIAGPNNITIQIDKTLSDFIFSIICQTASYEGLKLA